jgi:hypothetical protein
MKSLLLVLLLLVLLGTCSTFRYILSRRNAQLAADCPNKLKALYSTLYDEFNEKAKDFLSGDDIPNETISKIAFLLYQKENELKMQSENEKKQMQMQSENEKKQMQFEYQKDLMAMKMEQQKKESDEKQGQMRAFYLKQLSDVVQRLVVCLSVRIVNFLVFFSATYSIISLLHFVFCFHTDKFLRGF